MSNKEDVLKKEVTFFDLFADIEYLKLIAARMVSRFGDAIDIIAFSWLVYKLTGSKSFVALLFAFNSLPSVLFGVFAGGLVGYLSKKKVAFFTDIGRGIVVFITAIFYILNILQPWHLVLFTFLNSTFEAFRVPAATTLFSLILEKPKLGHGLSLDSSLRTMFELIGYSVVGILIAWFGIGSVIIIDAMTFFFSGTLIILIKYENDSTGEKRLTIRSYLGDLKNGLRFLLDNKVVMKICVFGSFLTFFLIPFNAMQAPYAVEVLKKGPEALAFISTSFLLGMILGSIVVPRLKKHLKSKKIIIIGGILLGFCYLLFSQLGRFPYTDLIYLPLIIISFTMGLSVPLINVTLQIAFYNNVSSEFMPRVSSIFNALILVANPLGAMIVAFLSKLVSLEYLYLYFSIFVIALFIKQIASKIMDEL